MVSTGVPVKGERPESEYVLMLLQCTLGIIMMLLLGITSKKLSIQIPSGMYIAFVIFLYCAIYLGEVQSFYYQVRHWDTILHTVSGGMLGALGFSFVVLLNNTKRVPVNISPVFVALFALEDDTLLIGREAIAYTIKDLFVDVIGALTISIVGYISIKYKKGWVERMLIKSVSKQK